MASPHLSIRIDPKTLERLDKASRRAGKTRSELAKTLIDEGLRMAMFPGLMFKPGPSGRRPAVIGGPDVWEVISILNEFKLEDPDPIGRTADWLSLHRSSVENALTYYGAFKEEIDDWIRENAELSHEAEDAWRRKQDLMR